MRLKFLAAFAAVALFAGCDFEVPNANAGSVIHYVDGKANRADLSKMQLDTFTTWLRANRTGWTREVTSAWAPLQVTLKNGDEPVAVALIGPGTIRLGDYVRPLASAERDTLFTLLAPPKNLEMKSLGEEMREARQSTAK